MAISEHLADVTKERVERVVGEARSKADLIAEFVTDSSEVADAINEAQEALWRVETIAFEVIDRRTAGT